MSESVIISTEPATGAELWRGEIGDVDAAVDRARRAWPAWAAQPLANRIELVRRFANEVRKEQDAFAELIARETGKPLWESHTEVEAVIAKVEISIRAYAERTGQRKLDSALQGTAALRHKPHGVMAVLGPYNFPAHLPNGHIVPALIAGNAVILKPSEKTPAVGEFLMKLFGRAGIDADLVQVLIGGPDEGKALVAHPDVDGVLFTGSAQAGIAINRKLAANPGKIVALEMGGNNPIVVWDTPKIGDAATLIVQSAFTTAGQRCTAARRLIVKSDLYDNVLDEVTRLTNRIIIGAPFDEPAPFMGPVIDSAAADQLTIPARMLAQKRLYSCGVPPISEPERPKRVLFASAIASSKLSTLMTCSSGPNSSTSGRSFIAVVSMMPGVTNGRSPLGRRKWEIALPPFDRK